MRIKIFSWKIHASTSFSFARFPFLDVFPCYIARYARAAELRNRCNINVQIKTGNMVEVVEREMHTKRNKQAKPARHGNTNKARKHIAAPDQEDTELGKRGIFCDLLFMPLMNSNNVILFQ